MGKINAATPQDTEMHIFGAGIPHYPWWIDCTEEKKWEDALNPPDDWQYRVLATNPDGGPNLEKMVGHEEIMKAALQIIEGKGGLNATIRQECSNLVFEVSDTDIDANMADAILQFIVFGDVPYC